MQPNYRVQIRLEIDPPAAGHEPLYVYRDLELPFVPRPGMVIQDFDGEQIRLAQEIVWRHAQHRFVAYAEPPEPVSGGVEEYERRGWARNRREQDRTAA